MRKKAERWPNAVNVYVCGWFALGNYIGDITVKGRVGKFEKPARDTLFVIFHGMLLTSR